MEELQACASHMHCRKALQYMHPLLQLAAIYCSKIMFYVGTWI